MSAYMMFKGAFGVRKDHDRLSWSWKRYILKKDFISNRILVRYLLVIIFITTKIKNSPCHMYLQFGLWYRPFGFDGAVALKSLQESGNPWQAEYKLLPRCNCFINSWHDIWRFLFLGSKLASLTHVDPRLLQILQDYRTTKSERECKHKYARCINSYYRNMLVIRKYIIHY